MNHDGLVWQRDVRGKPVSWLLGMAVAVELPDDFTRVVPTVRGYCFAHSQSVVESYRQAFEALAPLVWFGVAQVELGPREVDNFLAYADSALGSHRRDAAPPAVAGSPDCPQFIGSVRWGHGPHAEDARLRSGAIAWVCPRCGSAGMAYLR